MATRLAEMLRDMEPNPKFKPALKYSAAGDCLFLYLEEGESYRDRVDGILTVFRAIDDDRIVGLQIKGMSALVKRAGDYGYHFKEGEKVKLSLFLLISGIAEESSDDEEPERKKLYQELTKRAGQKKVNIEELQPA